MHNGKALVLVVEDSIIIRMGAVDLVRDAGYDVLEASDADEAMPYDPQVTSRIYRSCGRCSGLP